MTTEETTATDDQTEENLTADDHHRSRTKGRWRVLPECRRRTLSKYILGATVIGSFLMLTVGFALGEIEVPTSEEWGRPLAVIVVIIVLIGLVSAGLGLHRCRLNRQQRYYLARIDIERAQFDRYTDHIDCVRRAHEHDDNDTHRRRDHDPCGDTQSGLQSDHRTERRPDAPHTRSETQCEWTDVRYRSEQAQSRLTDAVDAVHQEDYVSFLANFYWANRQKVHVYDLLDRHTTTEECEPASVDTDADTETSRTARFRGMIDCPSRSLTPSPPPATETGLDDATEPAPDDMPRTRALTTWVRTTSASLPKAQQTQVAAHLPTDADATLLPTPQALDRAVMVIQERDIQQMDKLMTIRWFLRVVTAGFIPILLGIGLVATQVPVLTEIMVFNTLIGLTGVLGALFWMVFPMNERFFSVTSDAYGSIPDPSFIGEAVVLRMIVGGISALVLVGIILSPIDDGIFAIGSDDQTALLVVAFLAGFSEHLVKRSLEGAEERLSENLDDSSTSE